MRPFALIGCCAVLAAGPAVAAEPTGDWLVENGAAQIHIENCGGSLWGVVSWEKNPGGHDANNPDPSLRGRPILGMPTLIDLKPGRDDRWEGEVYNAENGKTYDVTVKLTNPNTLRIEGCVLGGFLCGGQDWTRVAQQPAGPAAAAQPSQTRGGPPAPTRGAGSSTGSASARPPAKGAAGANAAPVSDVCSRVSNLARGSH
jgi:uncharacterized protein (DUF2147 family)